MTKILHDFSKFFRSLVNSPVKLLSLATAAGFLLLAVMLFVPVFYRDSVNYVAAAEAFRCGNWRMAFSLTFPPLMFAFGALWMLFGFNAQQGVTIASGLLLIGSLWAAYMVLSFYMRKRFAAWGAVLFFLFPFVLRTGFSPLTDSGRWFFLFLSMALILSFLSNGKKITLFWLGCAYAGFSLTRSEGIVYVILLSGWFLWELARKTGSFRNMLRSSFRNLAFVLLPLCVAGALLAPRFYQLYKETGYAALDMRQTWAVRGLVKHFCRGGEAVSAGTVSVKDLTRSYGSLNDFNLGWFRNGKFHSRYWKNLWKGCFAPYLILAAAGTLIFLMLGRWKYSYSLFLVFLVVNAAVFFLMRSNAGRYFYLNAFFLTPLLVDTLRYLRFLIGKYRRFDLLPWAEFAILVCALVCFYAGMANLNYRGEACFPAVGAYMRRHCQIPSASGTEHPVCLVFGKNYGWGFQMRMNEIVFREVPAFASSVREMIRDGFPVEFCTYAVDNLNGIGSLRPDFLVFYEVAPEEFLSASVFDRMEEVRHGLSEDVKVFRVPRPEKKHER